MAPDYVTLPHTDKGIRNFEIATWLGKCSVVKPHTIFEPYIKKQEGVENEKKIREEQQGLTKSKNEERIKKKEYAVDSVLSLFSLDKAAIIWLDTRSFKYRMVCFKGQHI